MTIKFIIDSHNPCELPSPIPFHISISIMKEVIINEIIHIRDLKMPLVFMKLCSLLQASLSLSSIVEW